MKTYPIELTEDEIMVVRGALLTFNSDIESSESNIKGALMGLENLENKEDYREKIDEFKNELVMIEKVKINMISMDKKLPTLEED